MKKIFLVFALISFSLAPAGQIDKVVIYLQGDKKNPVTYIVEKGAVVQGAFSVGKKEDNSLNKEEITVHPGKTIKVTYNLGGIQDVVCVKKVDDQVVVLQLPNIYLSVNAVSKPYNSSVLGFVLPNKDANHYKEVRVKELADIYGTRTRAEEEERFMRLENLSNGAFILLNLMPRGNSQSNLQPVTHRIPTSWINL